MSGRVDSPRFAALLALTLVAAALAAPAWGADEPRITARLEPEVVGLDEAAVLTIEVGASGFASLAPRPTFDLENFEIAAGPSRAENFRFVNGETARSVSFQWQLRPLAVGAAKLRHLVVPLGDAPHKLPDLDARVETSSPPGRAARAPSAPADPFAQLFPELFSQRQSPRAAARAPKVRLAVALDPPEPYVGQQAVFTLYLLTQADVHRVSPRDLPEFRGFWVREIQLPDRPRPEWVEVDGERYGRVPLLRRALFPLSAGKFEIPPVTVDSIVEVTELTPWGTPLGRPAEVRRATERMTINVRPLPSAPESFAGAVGTLAVQARIEPASVTAGEAATLTLSVSGPGNLRSLPDPEPATPSGIRRFPPQSRSSEEVAGDRLKSARTWSYVLVPERSGSFDLPPFSLTYFDPKAGQFKTAASQPLSLEARARTGESDVAAARPEARNEPTPSAPEGPVSPAASTRPTWLLAAVWAGGGALTALAGVGAVMGWRRSRSPRAQSRRRLLARLDEARRENRPRQAAGAIEDAWRDYLSERWPLPPDSPIGQWGELLSTQGVGRETADRLVAFLGDLHLLRFAPELSATESLAADLAERSRQLARELH